MTTNWSAIAVALTSLLALIGFIVFLADLRTGISSLTDAVHEVRDEMKASNRENTRLHVEHSRRLGDHDIVLAKVNLLLDLDESAQDTVRESRRARRQHEHRERIRREHDRVSDEVRDIMQHEHEKTDSGDAP